MVVSRHQPFCVVFRKNGKLLVINLYFLNITLDLLGNFRAFLSFADFFSKSTFSKTGIPSECQTVWIQIKHYVI